MLTFDAETDLLSFFACVADKEYELEKTRRSLCAKETFEPYATFRYLDTYSKGYLTATDLATFLARFDPYVSDADVFALVRTFDKDGDDRLSPHEFAEGVLCADPTLRNLASERSRYALTSTLPNHTTQHFLNLLLRQEVDTNRHLELKRRALFARIDFHLLDGFRLLDSRNEGYLTPGGLTEAFSRRIAGVLSTDLKGILRRFDKDGDRRLSYFEYRQAVMPEGFKDPPLKISPSLADASTTYSPRAARSILSSPPLRTVTLPRPTSTPSLVRPGGSPRWSERVSARAASGAPLEIGLGAPQSPRRDITDTIRSAYRPSSPLATCEYDRHLATFPRSPRPMTTTSMLLPVERKVATAFKEQMILNREVERLKSDLAMRPDFCLLDFFRLCDEDHKGFASSWEMKIAFRLFGVYPDSPYLDSLVKRFSRVGDGRLRYTDVADALTPLDPSYADLLTSRVPVRATALPADILDSLTETTKLLIGRVLDGLLEVERQAAELKRAFIGVDMYEAYVLADRDGDGYVSGDELRDLLWAYGVRASNADIRGIFVRFDGLGGKSALCRGVTYGQFLGELAPRI
uniref:EF-hand domain-containing protein n=1 Tax=Chromera velia CCMP2878 TaxID=1169474 RepID=A0A0G4FQF5_9ALVE|mmetsp:Transcript_47281/g.93295  ORF Transcript_47281/g.93295 Transcript_47281/m.93295 type:complete len:577 (+) Transcript_47281:125-1855(+)|eukprot:Cvel_435.t1-p1 / transcript=Cvel_435.t1 / gene=Cvel_435 / organism=Chromera_velia_CCMP2878 / gene_product=hypothetical protein / transcript_product=hypothetical protein / location=Cvel_scaffold14:40874-45967(-) / protein_length=576 / sequence_SO=supercontig / SO=protein_coding / is_pseudo=false